MPAYNNQIHQAGPFRKIEQPALNGNAVYPGMLIETVNNTVNNSLAFQPHSTAGGFAERTFAFGDPLQGNVLANAYANAGDPVMAGAEAPGNLILALLKAGSNYTIGTKLISSGDGTLKPTTGTPSQIIAVITTPINLSSSYAVNTLSPVRVL